MPTFDANVLPSQTGLDLGSTAQRWDAFLQQMNISGQLTASGNIIPSATGNNLGSTTARWDAFLETVATGVWNGIHVVDGNLYPQTRAGIQSAFDAAGNNGVVILPPVTYTIDAAITAPYDNFTVIMNGALLNVEFNGVAFTFGAASTRHFRINVYGGWIRKAVSGTVTPDFTSGNVGIRFLNTDYCRYEGFNITGFESGLELRAENGEGQSYMTAAPNSILSCKFGIKVFATGAGSFVNENTFLSGGSLSYATADPDATGGYAIHIDYASSASIPNNLKFYGLSLENPTVTAGDPTGAVFANCRKCLFDHLRYEGFSSPFIFAGTDWLENVFAGGRGLTGPSVFDLSAATTPKLYTVMGEREWHIGGGAGTNPLLTLRETNSSGNVALRIENTAGGTGFEVESDGDIVTDLTPATNARLLGTTSRRWNASLTNINMDGVFNPLEGTLTSIPHWIFKQVDFGDMTAAATADTFTLWTLPANTMIHDVVGTVVTAWAGGTISAAVASVGTQAGSANDLTLDDDFFAAATVYELHDATASGGKGTLLFDSTDKFAPHMFVAGGVVELQMDLTGDNHANATAGQARIYALVSQPLGNTTTEAS